MAMHRINKLVPALRAHQCTDLSAGKLEALTRDQLLSSVRMLSQGYDCLLGEALALADATAEYVLERSAEYQALSQQLERERCDRKNQQLEYQRSLGGMNDKLAALTRLIAEKEEQVFVLRAALDEKQGHLSQLEQDSKDNLISLVNSQDAKTYQSLETQRIMIQQQVQQKISQLQQQNRHCIAQNALLCQRVQQLIQYINQLQQAHMQNSNQLSPQLIHAGKSTTRLKYSNQQQNQVSPNASSPSHSEFKYLEEKSCTQEDGAGRLVLREILNTEDRVSNNFGSLMHSKDRFNIHASNDQNNYNTLNIAHQTQEKCPPDNSFQRIQEFQTGETGLNPYRIFFTLISQCAKIDSPDQERACQVELGDMWTQFMEQRVPLHQWYALLCMRLCQKIN